MALNGAWSTVVAMDGTAKPIGLGSVRTEITISAEPDVVGTLSVKYRPPLGVEFVTPAANTIAPGEGWILRAAAIELELSGATSGNVVIASNEKAS